MLSLAMQCWSSVGANRCVMTTLMTALVVVVVVVTPFHNHCRRGCCVMLPLKLLSILLRNRVPHTADGCHHHRTSAAERRHHSHCKLCRYVSSVTTRPRIGRITGVQRCFGTALTLLGYSRREIIGKNISILVPQPMCAAHDSYLAAYCSTGVEVRSVHMQMRLLLCWHVLTDCCRLTSPCVCASRVCEGSASST